MICIVGKEVLSFVGARVLKFEFLVNLCFRDFKSKVTQSKEGERKI